jgi:hypothetical protein
MGLLNLFSEDGSNYSYGSQTGQPNTVLATNNSPMHYYSVGQNQYFAETNNGYMQYNDGSPNFLPQTSNLSFNNGNSIPTDIQYNLNQPE